eukprot:CAMPEP_0194309888 /NCGR_PEP_ID=MMETSP0171-20130528/6869_1 /TAXON_ID=218684 /ORGANISM="Corethron pennatum, Strain L29A3" /LENGTH=108 /DNA_ID=CAMNT_0039063273 /DNA_START=297 /DNA_END=620 /DNA_ORIENTATION=-
MTSATRPPQWKNEISAPRTEVQVGGGVPPPKPDRPHAQFDGYVDVKTPKKICAVGEEYKALLRSALEDYASYYEGGISRTAAKLMVTGADGESAGTGIGAEVLAVLAG